MQPPIRPQRSVRQDAIRPLPLYAFYNGFRYYTDSGIVVDNNGQTWTGIQPPGCVTTVNGYMVPVEFRDAQTFLYNGNGNDNF